MVCVKDLVRGVGLVTAVKVMPAVRHWKSFASSAISKTSFADNVTTAVAAADDESDEDSLPPMYGLPH